MTSYDLEEICNFLKQQAQHIGDEILIPMQKDIRLEFDLTKIVVQGAVPNISQAVTQADLIAQNYFLDNLIQSYPDARVIAEENTQTLGSFPNDSPHCFICDPIDGTHNYGNQSKKFGVSLGYAYDGEMRVGIVYLPAYNAMLTAIKGQGTFLNGNQIHIDKTKEPNSGDKIILNSKVGEEYESMLKANDFETLRPHCTVYSAHQLLSGQADAMVTINTTTHDIAPVALLIKEAGGIASRFDDTVLRFYNDNIVQNFIAAPNYPYKEHLLNLLNL